MQCPVSKTSSGENNRRQRSYSGYSVRGNSGRSGYSVRGNGGGSSRRRVIPGLRRFRDRTTRRHNRKTLIINRGVSLKARRSDGRLNQVPISIRYRHKAVIDNRTAT